MTSFSEFLGKGKLQKSSLGFGGSQCRRFTIYPVQKFPGCVDICSLYFSSHCELRVRFRFSWMNCQLQKLTHALLREDAPIGVSDAARRDDGGGRGSQWWISRRRAQPQRRRLHAPRRWTLLAKSQPDSESTEDQKKGIIEASTGASNG